LNFIPSFYQPIHSQASSLIISNTQSHLTKVNFKLNLLEPTAIKNNKITLNKLNFKLCQNYPNPFIPQTYIQFEINGVEQSDLTIYNMLGQKIRTLMVAKLNSGSYSICWDGKDELGNLASSGIYYCVLTVSNKKDYIKLLMLR